MMIIPHVFDISVRHGKLEYSVGIKLILPISYSLRHSSFYNIPLSSCVYFCVSQFSLHASGSGCVNWSVIDTEDPRAPVFFTFFGDGYRYPFPWANPYGT